MRKLDQSGAKCQEQASPVFWKTRKTIVVCICVAALGLAMLACPAGGLAASLDAKGEVLVFLGDLGDGEPAFGIEYDGLQLLAEAGSHRNSLFAGVGSFRWGPGRSGSLVMSGKAQPMPVVGYRLRRGNSDYVRFVGFMESEKARRLFGHRLEYAPIPNLMLGVSETAAASGDLSPALYLPFPGFPFYALQRAAIQQDRVQDRLININFGADFRAWWELPQGVASSGQVQGAQERPRMEIYGEVFIDDAQQEIANRDFIPDMVGGLIGVDLPRLPWDLRFGANVEYVAITNFVYSHKNPDNNYIYRDTVLGHSLGPDADMFVATLSFHPSERTELTLSGAVERRGEGRVGQSWSRQYGTEDWFLSGVVEKGVRVSVGIERELAGPVVLVGCVEHLSRLNRDNVLGESTRDWAAKIGIGARL